MRTETIELDASDELSARLAVNALIVNVAVDR